MFIQLPINKFILKDNKLFINESVIEYENISDESKEILESLISKGAYFSSLLELNSNYNVKTINEKEITSEDYTKYLQECKSLKKECIVETAALNYRPLTNIRGLEIMENDTSIARGKNNKLFVEDFRNNRLNEIYRETSDAAIELKYDLIDEVKKGLKRYIKSLDGKTVEEVYSIISDSLDYVKNYFNNKDGFNTIKYYITENIKLTEEDHASVWLKYQNKAEQLFEDAKRDLTEYEGMFEDFCDAVGNMAKNYTFGYNEDTNILEESIEDLDFKKYGIKRLPEEDFEDDGTYFKAYICNGVPITGTKYNGDYFLKIRQDYLHGLTYEEYSKLPSYKERDKYNGVSSVDLQDLANICKRTYKEYQDALKNVKEVSDDKYKLYVDKRLEKAINDFKEAKVLINSLKSEDLNNLDSYRTGYIIDCLNGLKDEINEWSWETKSQDDQANRRRNLKFKYKKATGWIDMLRETIEEIKSHKIDFSDILNNEDKRKSDIKEILKMVNEDEELREEAEGTQVDDVADKVDYEVGSLQKPKKPNHIVEMFNVPGTHAFKGFMMNEQGVYARGNYILINESGKIKAVNKKLYEEELNAYGDLIIPIEELDTRASELVMELNTVFNEYAEDDPLYDFGCRMEEDGIKIFDKNECFDYNSEEFENGLIDKIVQKYFGPNAYLEPENPVIFTIAGIDTDIDKYRNMFNN